MVYEYVGIKAALILFKGSTLSILFLFPFVLESVTNKNKHAAEENSLKSHP